MTKDSTMTVASGSRLAVAMGGLAALLGVLVLLGWAFDVAALKSVRPGLIAMQPLTAVCLALAGFALIAATRSTSVA